jgi:hypothetical protein
MYNELSHTLSLSCDRGPRRERDGSREWLTNVAEQKVMSENMGGWEMGNYASLSLIRQQ